MAYFVYILKSDKNGRYYTGSAQEVEARLAEHNRGSEISTKAHRPWSVVYTEAFETRAEANRRERQIKSMKSRKWIEEKLLNKPGS